MKQCKNCGGQLVFDIVKQSMRCRSCQSVFPAGQDDSEQKTAKENQYLETTSYECPQCGGLITTLSEEIAQGFCPYCGNSVTFQGKMDKMKKPGFILPFSYTKKSCKEAYRNHMARQFFAPKDLKDESRIDSFRGIYMPYWDFTVHQKGQINREYTDSYRRGDYIYTSHKRMSWDLDDYRTHILHDASSTFDDKIGYYVTPFEMQQVKDFHPDYMEGFYADTADVSSADCETVAFSIADQQTENVISSASAGDVLVNDNLTDRVNGRDREWNNATDHVNLLMLPLWFMSYKNGRRVSYAVVNGQTGKMYVDLPVEPWKYLLCVAAMTAVLTVFLGLLITPIPSAALTVTTIIQMIAMFGMNGAINRILQKDGFAEDDSGFSVTVTPFKVKKKLNIDISSAFWWVVLGFFLLPAVVGGASYLFTELTAFAANGSLALISLLIALIPGILIIRKSRDLKKGNGGHAVFPGYLLPLVSMVFSVVTLLIHPVDDIWYYLPMIISIVMLLLSAVSMIQLSNMRSSHMITHFASHTGGFDAAYDEE